MSVSIPQTLAAIFCSTIVLAAAPVEGDFANHRGTGRVNVAQTTRVETNRVETNGAETMAFRASGRLHDAVAFRASGRLQTIATYRGSEHGVQAVKAS